MARGMKTAEFRRYHGVKESTIHSTMKNLDTIRGSIKDKSHQVQELLVLCHIALFNLTNEGETRTGTQPAVNTHSQENRAKPTQQPGTKSYTGKKAQLPRQLTERTATQKQHINRITSRH
jgi:hypothetical protein